MQVRGKHPRIFSGDVCPVTAHQTVSEDEITRLFERIKRMEQRRAQRNIWIERI